MHKGKIDTKISKQLMHGSYFILFLVLLKYFGMIKYNKYFKFWLDFPHMINTTKSDVNIAKIYVKLAITKSI